MNQNLEIPVQPQQSQQPPPFPSGPTEPSRSTLAVGYLSHWGALIAVILLMTVVLAVLSVMKGWWAFFLIPALLPVMGVAVATQGAALASLRPRGGPAEMSRTMAALVEILAAAQLLAVAGAYFCIPAFGDTSDSSAFTFIWADTETFIVKLSGILAVVSGVAAVGVTVVLVILLVVLANRSRRLRSAWR
ncbi:hypothetical protein Kisp02_73250 [Kineosporia sp. NBRC 101731]|nr:hypothetical protein Kisp02_73250 [Kineosporia sp. NBRC 101731]